ncbi:hypothetical protein MUP01_06145 [Candidatus Bathyarchaeota archaeon]|nr:hypothetical protein [Candidatus Bathyarchaeota archaeon]
MHNECGCQRHHGYSHDSCHANHHGHFGRHFLTKAEKIERLENYTQELKNELTAVQERIKELKSNK